MAVFRQGDLPKRVDSPNFSPDEIPVEFVVLHYTATTLERTLEIFRDPARQVSSHLVIDRDGTVYEVVPCLSAPACKAWHAGKSCYESTSACGKSERFEGFNSFSVGIELVNVNGNVFPFTNAQYESLANVFQELLQRYPRIGLPGRVVGHSEIAGFRGKCDPGRLFEWGRLQTTGLPADLRGSRAGECSEQMASVLRDGYDRLGVSLDLDTGAFVVPAGAQRLLESISSEIEAAMAKTEVGNAEQVASVRTRLDEILSSSAR
jgi:N-acetylmuramoyl-L-alanine amidase